MLYQFKTKVKIHTGVVILLLLGQVVWHLRLSNEQDRKKGNVRALGTCRVGSGQLAFCLLKQTRSVCLLCLIQKHFVTYLELKFLGHSIYRRASQSVFSVVQQNPPFLTPGLTAIICCGLRKIIKAQTSISWYKNEHLKIVGV